MLNKIVVLNSFFLSIFPYSGFRFLLVNFYKIRREICVLIKKNSNYIPNYRTNTLGLKFIIIFKDTRRFKVRTINSLPCDQIFDFLLFLIQINYRMLSWRSVKTNVCIETQICSNNKWRGKKINLIELRNSIFLKHGCIGSNILANCDCLMKLRHMKEIDLFKFDVICYEFHIRFWIISLITSKNESNSLHSCPCVFCCTQQ